MSKIEDTRKRFDHWRDLVRRKPVSIATLDPRVDQGKKHCILLHGWHSTHGYMRGIERALWELPTALPCRFWQVTYDTHWKSSAQTARDIMDELGQSGHNFDNTVLIGYSMGGVVARQMMAQGFVCRDLVALCAPHQGSVPWLPNIDPGAWSLARRSRELAALNADKGDEAWRKRYHFFAITYTDRRGYHDHDGIVTRRSALGESLGPVATRQVISLKYRGLAADFDPHIRGMDARFMQPALRLCAALFEAL